MKPHKVLAWLVGIVEAALVLAILFGAGYASWHVCSGTRPTATARRSLRLA